MDDIDEEILDRISDLTVSCPECECMYSDDQYQCGTCWSQGGQGRINVLNYLKENKKLL